MTILKAFAIHYTAGHPINRDNKRSSLVIAYTVEEAVQHWRNEVNQIEFEGAREPIDPEKFFTLGQVQTVGEYNTVMVSTTVAADEVGL